MGLVAVRLTTAAFLMRSREARKCLVSAPSHCLFPADSPLDPGLWAVPSERVSK